MNPLTGRRNFLKQSASASVSVGAMYSLSQAILRAKAHQGYLIMEQAWSGLKGNWVNDFKTGLSAPSSMEVLNELLNIEV